MTDLTYEKESLTFQNLDATRVIATTIGVGAGVANIVFRTVTEMVHDMIFVPGSAFANSGGWHILLLPLIPMAGMVLLIPLSLMYPGQVNGYGFPKFLRKVNLEGGMIKFRNIVIKILSCGLTIGTGGSAGVEGPIAQVEKGIVTALVHVLFVDSYRGGCIGLWVDIYQ